MPDAVNVMAAEESLGIGLAIRTVLAKPLITYAAYPEAFALVNRHKAQVAQWFSNYCGWSLDVDARSGSVRLHKHLVPDQRHPLRRPRGGNAPFDRRRYVMLCLAAAELIGSPVVLLAELGETIADQCAADPELPEYRRNHGPHRSALVDVVLFLQGIGALEIVDGLAEAWQIDGEYAVLLRAQPAVLMSLLVSPQPPSQITRRDIGELAADPKHDIDIDDESEAGRARYNVVLRQRIMRRLADTAVLYFDEMTSDEIAYTDSLTGRRQIESAAATAGMACEWRSEGIMWIDGDRIASDLTFPDKGGNSKQAALLFIDFLLERRTATEIELEGEIHRLLDLNPQWAKEYRAAGGPSRMTAEAVELLCDFGLARRAGPTVELRPAADRYRVTEVNTSGKERP